MMSTMDVMPLSTLEMKVMAKPTRRRYSAEYKLRILREVDASTRPGEIGVLLRREGLYSSNLTAWRKQREKGKLEGLSQKRRGPLPKEKSPLADKVNDSKSIRAVNLLVGTAGPKNGFPNCLITNERESGRAPGRGQNQVSDDLAH